MPDVTEYTEEIGDQPAFWRSATMADGGSPILYLHGVPTNSDDWVPFLERTGGLAPDLPGFGRSGKRGDVDFTMAGYDAWLEAFLDHLDIDRFRLVVHDWGAVGLLLAQRFPERVERLVVMNAVPLLPGYKWHRVARMWRTRLLGEFVMGSTSLASFRLISREANTTPGPLPEPLLRSVVEHLDQGTQRAILKLYRTSPPDALARAGLGLGDVSCPALVVWGQQDPYIGPAFGRAYADVLPAAELAAIEGAGHWPWLDRPEVIDTVAAFLEG